MKSQQPAPKHPDENALTSVIDRALMWLQHNRALSSRLAIEADSLQTELLRQRTLAENLATAAQSSDAIGLYGQSPAGKIWLAERLLGNDNGRVLAAIGSTLIDYLSLLNPHKQNLNLAVRFTSQPPAENNHFPLQLSVLSESELVAVLVQQAEKSDTVTLSEQQLTQRLLQLNQRRQKNAVEGITPAAMVALWDMLTLLAPRQLPDSGYWLQAIELAPWLEVDDRACLFAVLWQDQPQLTALYRQLAHVLHQLACSTQLRAPLSLLNIPSFWRSGQQESGIAASIELQPGADQAQSVTVRIEDLTLLCREILLPLAEHPREALFDTTDLIDYPGLDNEPLLPGNKGVMQGFLQARRALILYLAAARHQVSHLLICSAATSRNESTMNGALLRFWVEQSVAGGADKPALIWALTPFDQRHSYGQHYDGAVQRMAGALSGSWGTMLAMDENDTGRMADYLTSTVSAGARQQQLAQRSRAIATSLRGNLLGRWHLTKTQDAAQRSDIAAQLLKALQARTGVHGELLEHLLPQRERLRQLFLRDAQQNISATDHASDISSADDPFGLGVKIDLLSDEPFAPLNAPQQVESQQDGHSDFATRVYHHWVNLLRQLPENAALLTLLNISKSTMALLCEELITASVRLEISEALTRALTRGDIQGMAPRQMVDRQVSRALNVLGDFVAWLGFQLMAEEQRPESRINPGHKIFARPEAQTADLGTGQRLTRLALKPGNHAGFYIYDWLVALNATVASNAGYAAAREISTAQRNKLVKILSPVDD